MKRNAILASFVVLLAATSALAQTEWAVHKKATIDVFPQAKGGAPWWHGAWYIQSLGLTADQQKKMDDVLHESRLRLIPLEAALKVQETIMEPLMAAEQVDEAKVLAQIERVAQARADLEKANARMLLGIRQVLTLDQWTRLQHPNGLGSYFKSKAEKTQIKPLKE